MADSPAKRHKTSPTTFTPIDAPTPSRIPVPSSQRSATKPSSRRPSFASPTKASLARHNPQLLNRPTSSGSGSARPSRGNLNDVFARALGEAPAAASQPAITSTDRDISRSASTTQENEPEVMAKYATQPAESTTPRRSTKSIGGGLSTKPRRLSRSPAKRPERPQIQLPDVDPLKDLPKDYNPFQKKGLRRSPVPGQAATSSQQEEQMPLEDIANPFAKTGLRRSPVSSQPLASLGSPQNEAPMFEATTPIPPVPPEALPEAVEEAELPHPQIEAPAYISTTPTELEPTKVAFTEELREASPIQPDEPPQSDPLQMPEEYIPAPQSALSARPGIDDLFQANRSERPEPELPPTPTQRGIPDPIVTTPPTGIHNTPSKRARRNKALSEKLKSSPLKPKDPPPQGPPKEKQPEVLEDVKRPQPESVQEPVKRRKSARFLIPEDPHAAKKKIRDGLFAELQQLQADVALANQENERLRRAEYKRKRASTASNSEDLFAMLTRATAPERPSKPQTKPKSIFKSINTFLPFHPRKKSAPAPVSEKPLPSHLPIALDDPLPYLQAFTPLTYTSTITLLPADPPASDESSQVKEQVLMQKHFITASHHSGLFVTRFAMTVNTSTLSIAAIDILRLDMNAEKELGTFIRGRARDEGPLGKDVTVICWAMSRWVEVSIKRAQFWCAVEKEFGTPEARIASLQRKRKRKRAGSVIDGEPSADAEDTSEKTRWTRKQLLEHFGRSSMELSGGDVELRFEWKISFDWTGEVESSISAAARMPKHWAEADERKSLAKVPQTFDKLRNEQGPLGAMRAMVGLMMPTS